MVRFYIDSANRATVESALSTGLFDGVTTNPSILAREGLNSEDIPDFVAWAEGVDANRIFVQTWGSTRDELVERGEWLRNLSPNIVVKIPYSLEGMVASHRLVRGGDVLVTAVHSAAQALPIAASGATYMAPFITRMDLAGRNGLEEAAVAQEALSATNSATRVLAGSLRTPEQVLTLVRRGVNDFTLGESTWDSFFSDPVTRAAVDTFEALAEVNSHR